MLLEVLIAIFLFSMIAIPLMGPQVFLFKQQQKLINQIALDRLIARVFADVTVKLYQNEIPWSTIESESEIPIIGYGIEELPYVGSYRFSYVISKPDTPQAYSLYLYDLVFTFRQPNSAEEPIQVRYTIFLTRNLQTGFNPVT